MVSAKEKKIKQERGHEMSGPDNIRERTQEGLCKKETSECRPEGNEVAPCRWI